MCNATRSDLNQEKPYNKLRQGLKLSRILYFRIALRNG